MHPEQKLLVPLRDIPPTGRSYTVAEASLWTSNIESFHIDCRLQDTPTLTLDVLPTDEGWLLRGRIQATVIVPCSRCAADMTISLDEAIEDYVQSPDSDEEVPSNTFAEGDDHLVVDHGTLYLDLGAIAWEQFALALPPRPLCQQDCKGLCTQCGKNLNEGPCACQIDEGDPRLAVLRGLKLKKA